MQLHAVVVDQPHRDVMVMVRRMMFRTHFGIFIHLK